MSKASNFITIAIVLFIAVILVPIVVNQVQISEQEVNTLQKSAYLYPQTDGSLATSPASSGAYTVDCSTTGNKTLKQFNFSKRKHNIISSRIKSGISLLHL